MSELRASFTECLVIMLDMKIWPLVPKISQSAKRREITKKNESVKGHSL